MQESLNNMQTLGQEVRVGSGFHMSHQLPEGAGGPSTLLQWQGCSLQGERQVEKPERGVLGAFVAPAPVWWEF